MDVKVDEPEGVELLPAVKKLHERCQIIRQDWDIWQTERPIVGAHRYLHSLESENQFLERLIDDPEKIRKKYIEGTNLNYLESIHQLMSIVRAEEVMRIIDVPPPESAPWMSKVQRLEHHPIKVHLVANRGLVWIKVIARNAKSLRFDIAGLEWSDDDEDGQVEDIRLPLLKRAEDYLKSAKAHHVHYRTPQVVFAFMRIHHNEDKYVQRIILDRLSEMGVRVYLAGMPWETIDVPPTLNAYMTHKVNMDVSSVMALISELAHHPCLPEHIRGDALKWQARQEQTERILPVVCDLIANKELYMVQSAYDRLKSITEVVGGERENRRFAYLFRPESDSLPTFDPELWTIVPPHHIRVIPDAPSPAYLALLKTDENKKKSKVNNGRKIRTGFEQFHAIIFGSGDTYRMTTVTSIQWIKTALEDAGIFGEGIVTHNPRSLAEQKMYNVEY